MIFRLFRRRDERLAPVKALLARVAEASRVPWLYAEAGIPDDFEGRFDSFALHAFLVLRRLRELPAPAADVAQDFVDQCFAYLEIGFRQNGVSDIAVPKKMKKVAQGFYGRVNAYEAALDSGDPEQLVAALARNASGSGARLLADYVERSRSRLAGADLDAILGDGALFVSPVELGHG